MKVRKNSRKRGTYNPACCLIAPIQKGFPVTDFEVTKDHRYLIAGNAFGCITAFRVPPERKLEDLLEEDEKKEDDVFFCHQLKKYGPAAVRHLWIQTDEKSKTSKVYAVIGFNKVFMWSLEDILKPSASGKQNFNFQRKNICHKFEKTETEKFSTRHACQLAIFASDYRKMHLVDFSDGIVEQKVVVTNWRLPKKTKVVSFNGSAFCFLQLNQETGRRELLFKDFSTFSDYAKSMPFEKVGTNYSCFQLVGRKLAYCSNNNVVKVYDLDKSEIVARCKGHKGYILATHYDGNIIATLGTDRKLKLWRDGECIGKIKNIPGVFNPGYLYKVWHNKSKIYYSADDGIYVAYL